MLVKISPTFSKQTLKLIVGFFNGIMVDEFSCKKGPYRFDLITKIPVFGFSDKTRLKPVSSATETS